MATIPVTDAKARLNALVEEVATTHERVVLTLRGRPAVVMMSIDDLEALEETVFWLSDPATRDAVREARGGLEGAPAYGEDEVRAMVADRLPAAVAA